MSFTPRSFARWYGFAPSNAGKNEWWMLIVCAACLSQKSSDKTCMYRAITSVSAPCFSMSRSIRAS